VFNVITFFSETITSYEKLHQITHFKICKFQ